MSPRHKADRDFIATKHEQVYPQGFCGHIRQRLVVNKIAQSALWTGPPRFLAENRYAPSMSRTCNPLLRTEMLYPFELCVHEFSFPIAKMYCSICPPNNAAGLSTKRCFGQVRHRFVAEAMGDRKSVV